MDYSVSGNIRERFKIIGKVLLEIEESNLLYSFLPKQPKKILQENLAFMPTEVLEAYLEDLIDFTISDEELYIKNAKDSRFELLTLLSVVGTTMVMSYSGFELLSTSLTVGFIIILAAVIQKLTPSILPNRRLFFARILSAEISRRNGDQNKDKSSIFKEIIPEQKQEWPVASKIITKAKTEIH